MLFRPVIRPADRRRGKDAFFRPRLHQYTGIPSSPSRQSSSSFSPFPDSPRHAYRPARFPPGPNGSGKTTLLRAIAGRLPPFAGRMRLGANIRPGFLAQEQETLDPEHKPLQTVRAEITADETGARLMLALLAARGANFLLLDEPINHLDIPLAG